MLGPAVEEIFLWDARKLKSVSGEDLDGWNRPNKNWSWVFFLGWHTWNNRRHTNMKIHYILGYQESRRIKQQICGKDEWRQERGHFPINSCSSLNRLQPQRSLEIDLCHVMLSISTQKACEQNLQDLDKTSNFEITSPSFSFIWTNICVLSGVMYSIITFHGATQWLFSGFPCLR